MIRAHVFKIPCAVVVLASVVGARPARAQRCAPGGTPVLVSEGRGATQPSIAATAQGIVVSWSEGSTTGWIRVLNANTLSPVGPARRVSDARGRGAISSAIALAPLADGRIAEGHCSCSSGRATCAASLALGAGALANVSSASSARATCTSVATSGAAVGNDVLFVSQFAARDRARTFGTAVVAREELTGMLAGDAHALVPVANARALLLVQSSDHGTARLLDARGAPVGAAVPLSTPRMLLTASASTRINDSALVLFAQRPDASAATSVHVARWNGTRPPVHAELDLGERNVSPLSVVASNAGCYLLAWRAPSATKIAQVCSDRLVPGSIATVPIPAGATQVRPILASNGVEAFVLTLVERDQDATHNQLYVQRLGCR